MPDAWVNLGNVYLAQQQYTAAIQMYRGALRRFYDNRNAVVMLYLARYWAAVLHTALVVCLASWEAEATSGLVVLQGLGWGLFRVPACQSPPIPWLSCRAHYDADQLPEAKRTLTKALHLAPTDHKLRFNVAVTMQVGGAAGTCWCWCWWCGGGGGGGA
jgi:RNA polymerase-associated protein CTR9